MSQATDTIVAVSSPPGRSYRGLIRIAGPDAFAAAGRILAAPLPTATGELAATRLAEPAIPALVVRFAAPRSYTGDDLVELQVPGHPALLERLLQQLVDEAQHIRLAEPGEFTFRAYLNGRLTLTEAEGVAATIAAASDAQLAAAGMLRHGRLAAHARAFTDDLAATLALLEAGIDFTDQDDVVPLPPQHLAERLAALTERIDELLSRSRSWGALEALPRVVLVGPPSVGKSTLFNALLGRERAVVHDLPGTTRDLLAEPLRVAEPGRPPLEVMLVDIAGLHEPHARLDRQAQAAADSAIRSADLILALADPPAAAAGVPVLRIRAKADVWQGAVEEESLPVSAVTGLNLDALRVAIAARLRDRGLSTAGEALALQPRHQAALTAARDALAAAGDLLHHGGPPTFDAGLELIAGSLRQALDSLASLGGEMTPDDVIGKVFATFCVGK